MLWILSILRGSEKYYNIKRCQCQFSLVHITQSPPTGHLLHAWFLQLANWHTLGQFKKKFYKESERKKNKNCKKETASERTCKEKCARAPFATRLICPQRVKFSTPICLARSRMPDSKPPGKIVLLSQQQHTLTWTRKFYLAQKWPDVYNIFPLTVARRVWQI